MKYSYYALTVPDSANTYDVLFPDLPGCNTFGNGFEDAINKARDALTGYLEVELKISNDIPDPSDLYTTIDKLNDDIIKDIRYMVDHPDCRAHRLKYFSNGSSNIQWNNTKKLCDKIDKFKNKFDIYYCPEF